MHLTRENQNPTIYDRKKDKALLFAPETLNKLQANEPSHKKCTLLPLSLFLDGNFLRARGRLRDTKSHKEVLEQQYHFFRII